MPQRPPTTRTTRTGAAIGAALLGLAALGAGAARGAEFTVRLVKADHPDELVQARGLDQARKQQTEEDEKPEGTSSGKPSFFDLTSRTDRRSGTRVVTWVRNFRVDGKPVFQKRYKGKFLLREPTATIELDDGEHVLDPGGHVVTVAGEKVTTEDPELRVEGSVISVPCYPVFFGGLDMSADPDAPLGERFAYLPGRYFSVQAFDETAPPDGADADAPRREAWTDLLVEHGDFKPLIVYLPANTRDRAYRILPSGDELKVSDGRVRIGDRVFDSGVRVEDDLQVWIPRYTQRVVVRQKTQTLGGRTSGPSLLHVSLERASKDRRSRFTEAASATVPSAPTPPMRGTSTFTLEKWHYFHLLPDRRLRDFRVGPADLPPPEGIEIPSDLTDFPHRLLVADNRHPASDAALHLAVALDRNTCRAGEHIRARVRFADVSAEVLGEAQVAAFIRAKDARDGPWQPVSVTPAEASGDLYHLAFPDSADGLHRLRVVVDRGGAASPESRLHADFTVGLEAPDAPQGSVSVFTHYNRESFHEGEGIELVTVVKTASPVKGTLEVHWQHADGGAKVTAVRRPVDLPAGEHPTGFYVPPEFTIALRPGRYRVSASLGDYASHEAMVTLVSRKRDTPMRIAMHGGGFTPTVIGYGNADGRRVLIDNLKSIGINQVISPPTGLGSRALEKTWQERVDTAGLWSLPAKGYLYRPDRFQASMDALLAAGMEAWLWRTALIENVRWGPFPELDHDRYTLQYLAKLARRWPNAVGIDMSWWMAVNYTDMGKRPGLNEPEQQEVRRKLFAKRYEQRFGEPVPEQKALRQACATGENYQELRRRWLQRFYMRAGLLGETCDQFSRAIHRVDDDLECTVVEFDVCAQGPHYAVVPEIMYAELPLSRWGSTCELGSRPLNTAFMTALGAFDPSKRVSTLNLGIDFHKPHLLFDRDQLWQRSYMALACGADEIGYNRLNQHRAVHGSRKLAGGPGPGACHLLGKNHLLEHLALSALNRGLRMYGGVFDQAERRRKLAVLYSQTQRGLEHTYQAIEWHGLNPLVIKQNPPFHKGTQQIRVFGAFYSLLASHMPADVITEHGIRNDKLGKYEGVVITGLEGPLPEDVVRKLEAYIDAGGVVLMDDLNRSRIPGVSTDIRGAKRLEFGFDVVKTGWSDAAYRGIRQEFLKIRQPLREVLDEHFDAWARCDDYETYLSRRSWGDSDFLIVSSDRVAEDGDFYGQYEREPSTATVTVRREDAVVYDLIDQRRVEVTEAGDGSSTFDAVLTDVGTKLFAVLPDEPAAPRVRINQSVRAGRALSVEVRTDPPDGADAGPGVLTPIQITVTGADGERRYRVYRAVRGAGPFTETFKVGRNEPAGQWRVSVCELFSGKTSAARCAVTSNDSPWPEATEPPATAVHDAERVRSFLSRKKKVAVVYEASDAGMRAVAQRAAEILDARGIEASLMTTDEVGFMDRREVRIGFARQGLTFDLKTDVVLLDRRGSNALVSALAGVLPVRPCLSYPAPGRAVVMHVVAPFSFGNDAVVVTGGDMAGLRRAVERLAHPEKLADAHAPAVAQVEPARTELVAASPPGEPAAVPDILDADLHGLPVTHLLPAADGDRILAVLGTLGDNLHMLDGDGRRVWSGKGAKKWTEHCRLTPSGEVVAVCPSRSVYHVDAGGNTVRRMEDLGRAALSADGRTMIVCDRDRTYGMRLNGEQLWEIDHFPKRKTWEAMAGFHHRDDWVALAPDGQVGLIFKRNYMRTVDMRNGRTALAHEFEPFAFQRAHLDPAAHFSADSRLLAVTTNVGHVYVFTRSGRTYEFRGMYEAPYRTPGRGLPGSELDAPPVNAESNPTHFISMHPRGKSILMGFTSDHVVLLNPRAEATRTLRFEHMVSAGALLGEGFVVYADGHLRWYDEAGEPLRKVAAPLVYTMAAMPDGESVVCGTPGGTVFRVDGGGGRVWRRRLRLPDERGVDRQFAQLAAAERVKLKAHTLYDTEMQQIEANVTLLGNVLPAIADEKAWKATAAAWDDAAAVVDAGGTLARRVDAGRLAPSSAYVLEVACAAVDVPGRVEAEVEVADGTGEPATISRTMDVGLDGSDVLVLPVKTGPEPKSAVVRVGVLAGERCRVERVTLRPLHYDMDNVLAVPEAFAGDTKTARSALRKRAKISFRVLHNRAGMFDMTRQVEPVDMVDSRVAGRRWSPGGYTGGVELSLDRPRSIGAVTFYDDPRDPQRYKNGYFIDYYHAPPQPEEKRDPDSAAHVDEIDFKEKYGGEWRRLLTVREWKGPVHAHSFDTPVTTDRLRILGFSNQSASRGIHISEVEVYETAWPTSGGSFRRARYVRNGRVRGEMRVVRRVYGSRLGGRSPNFTAPVFADGVLYLGVGHRLMATRFNAEADRLWEYESERRKLVRGTPTVAGELVLFGSSDHMLRAVDRSTGELQWSFAANFKVLGSCCVIGSTVVQGAADGVVYGIDLHTGEQQWRFDTGLAIRSDVATDGRRAYVSSGDGKVYAIDPSDGEPDWSFATGGAVRSGVVVGGDKLYVGSDDGCVYALGLSDGEVKWKRRTGDYVEAAPAVDDETVYVGSLDGSLRAYDRHSGEPRWRFDAGKPIRHAALVMGDDVFFHAGGRRLWRLDKRSGEQVEVLDCGRHALTTDLSAFGARMIGVGASGGGYLVIAGGPRK
ncbi:MAG: PQQ-binding-like beta-propeller repeat protein [Planctomycetota bacterium]